MAPEAARLIKDILSTSPTDPALATSLRKSLPADGLATMPTVVI